MKGEFLRRSLVLLAGAVLIFAPGWGGEASVSLPTTASDVAGRILAPTFDEASVERTGTGTFEKRMNRAKPYGHSSKIAPSVSGAAQMQPPAQFLLASLVALILVASRRLPNLQAQRAPPHLLTP
jgi:hypothetical protein